MEGLDGVNWQLTNGQNFNWQLTNSRKFNWLRTIALGFAVKWQRIWLSLSTKLVPKALNSIVPLFSSDNVIKCAFLGVILAGRILSSEWGRYKGNCKLLLRWFRDGFLVFLRSTSQCYTYQLFLSQMREIHLVMTEISGNVPATSEDFRRITEYFRTLPKTKCPLMFQKTFEHFPSYLKDDTFSALWHDFVRVQKRTQSHHVLRLICSDLWVRREKLSLIREIDVFSPQA